MENDKKIVTSWVSIFLLFSLLCNTVFLWRNTFEMIDSLSQAPALIVGHPGASQGVVKKALYSEFDVKDRIRAVAFEYDYPDVDRLISLAECESSLKLTATNGAYTGLYQIDIYLHPEVTYECATSLLCSTIWTIQQLDAGRDDMWPNCLK